MTEAYRGVGHTSLGVDLSYDRLELLEIQEQFLHSQGFLRQRVDVRGWADPAPLRRARALVARRPPY